MRVIGVIPMPDEIKQDHVIKVMEGLGYSVDDEGMCFGLCSMANQACLANDLDTFMRRLNVIQTFDLSRSIPDQIAALPNEQRIDILAFFDGITLLQSAKKNKDLIPEGTDRSKLYQGKRFHEKLTKSLALDTSTTKHQCLTTTTYSKDTNVKQLKLILQHYGKQPFALNIGSVDHATTLLYSPTPEPGVFTYFDPNHMPRSLSKEEVGDVVDQIAASLHQKPFSLEISILDNPTSQQALKNLSADKEWINIRNPQTITADLYFLARIVAEDEVTRSHIESRILEKKLKLSAVLSESDMTLRLIEHSDTERTNYSNLSKKDALEAVKINGLALKKLEQFQEDEEIVIAAYQTNPKSAQFGQKELVKQLIKDRKVSFEHIPDEICQDEIYINELITSCLPSEKILLLAVLRENLNISDLERIGYYSLFINLTSNEQDSVFILSKYLKNPSENNLRSFLMDCTSPLDIMNILLETQKIPDETILNLYPLYCDNKTQVINSLNKSSPNLAFQYLTENKVTFSEVNYEQLADEIRNDARVIKHFLQHSDNDSKKIYTIIKNCKDITKGINCLHTVNSDLALQYLTENKVTFSEVNYEQLTSEIRNDTRFIVYFMKHSTDDQKNKILQAVTSTIAITHLLRLNYITKDVVSHDLSQKLSQSELKQAYKINMHTKTATFENLNDTDKIKSFYFKDNEQVYQLLEDDRLKERILADIEQDLAATPDKYKRAEKVKDFIKSKEYALLGKQQNFLGSIVAKLFKIESDSISKFKLMKEKYSNLSLRKDNNETETVSLNSSKTDTSAFK